MVRRASPSPPSWAQTWLASQDATAIPDENRERVDKDTKVEVPAQPNQLLPCSPMPLTPDCRCGSFCLHWHAKCLSASVERTVAAHTKVEFTWSAINKSDTAAAYPARGKAAPAAPSAASGIHQLPPTAALRASIRGPTVRPRSLI